MSAAWKPRSLTGGASSPVDEINSLFTKISGKNFPALRDRVINIKILEDIGSDTGVESPMDETRDIEQMKPVVDSFMNNLKYMNDDSAGVEIYANLFIAMKKEWIGRHGRIVEKLFNTQLQNFIKDYIGKKEKTTKDNLEMNTLARFIALLYDKGEVPSLYIMKIMEVFYGDSSERLNVVARILKVVISKLKSDPYFKAKLEKKYRDLMTTNMNLHGGAFKFLVEDILKLW